LLTQICLITYSLPDPLQAKISVNSLPYIPQ